MQFKNTFLRLAATCLKLLIQDKFLKTFRSQTVTYDLPQAGFS